MSNISDGPHHAAVVPSTLLPVKDVGQIQRYGLLLHEHDVPRVKIGNDVFPQSQGPEAGQVLSQGSCRCAPLLLSCTRCTASVMNTITMGFSIE
jgi:hypothetical protein